MKFGLEISPWREGEISALGQTPLWVLQTGMSLPGVGAGGEGPSSQCFQVLSSPSRSFPVIFILGSHA